MQAITSSVSTDHISSVGPNEPFDVSQGVKQGRKELPTILSLHINDLMRDMNAMNCGVTLDHSCISIFSICRRHSTYRARLGIHTKLAQYSGLMVQKVEITD